MFSAAWTVRSGFRLGGPTTDGPRIEYRPRPDVTLADEIRTLATVYTFVLERYEQKQIAAEAHTDADNTEAERGNQSGEVRPAKKGGGQHA